ncbi:uncharacterized protein LOC127723177 [Mytilus californianus]|uniref:uncharacterized protein LOC127723177 n=1 Tax=Mytilus californianus TaxID=6549 RepID=UPI002245B121|nr:uncharacterized protein LOC127723177 [Mytilus californianus]
MLYSKSHFNTTPGDYKIHSYDRVHEYNHVHDYNHIHDYNKIHEYDKIYKYDKIREYKYHEYQPTKTQQKKPRPIIDRPAAQPVKRKRKSRLEWPDKPIYTHTFRPYEYIPPPQLRNYEYTEYQMDKDYYINRKLGTYRGSVDYKLTPDNYYPFRYRKGKQKREDFNNNEEIKREASLRDIDFKEPIYKPETRREVKLPTKFVYMPKAVLKTQAKAKPATPVYKPEVRQQEVLPTAFVFAPAIIKKAETKPQTPVYQPEERQEEILPNAFMFAPIVVTKSQTQAKPQTPLYQPEERQENVLPSAYVIAPRAVQKIESPTPEKSPSPVIAKQAAAAAAVRRASPVHNPSPVRSIYTPIGSRSPSPGLPPVGAILAGGMIGAAVVSNKSEKKEQEKIPKQSTPQPPSPERQRSPSIQNVVVAAAVVGATSPSPEPLSKSTPKPTTPQPPPVQPAPAPKAVAVAASVPARRAALSVGSPKPERAPTPAKLEARHAPVAKAGVVAAASVPALSKPVEQPKTPDNQYKEEPSTWSPVPNRKRGLPPEIIATIEAYDRAHGKT